MRSFFLALATFFVGGNLAQATVPAQFPGTRLRIPLQFETINKRQPLVCEVNLKLKKLGADPLPDTLIFDTRARTAPYDQMKDYDEQVERAAKLLKMDLSRRGELTPASNNTKTLVTCYEGNPKEVKALIEALIDIGYSDQLRLLGMKYKSTVEYFENNDDGVLEDHLSDNSEAWQNWRGKGEAILLTMSVGDDGDDVQTSIIRRCKK
jgi:hypothetical protein